MPSSTARLGLARPLDSDAHGPEVIYNALTLLDSYPGVYMAADWTELNALTWGASQTGMLVMMQDEGTLWRWDGTKPVRHHPSGLLGSSQITSDFTTALTTAQTAISCTVTVPRTTTGLTKKRIRVMASFYGLDNENGQCEVSLVRSTGSVSLKVMRWSGFPDTETEGTWGPGGTIEAYDAPAVAGGSITYTLCINSTVATGGTSVLRASASHVASLEVEEVSV